MLENTHTIDANYVYRDLKELSIDLGYYEKEELFDRVLKLQNTVNKLNNKNNKTKTPV